MQHHSKSNTRPEPQHFRESDFYSNNQPTVSPQRGTHFRPMDSHDSDEDNLSSYTVAFGTTIENGDYMDVYQKHNRANSKLSQQQGLVSPSVPRSQFVDFSITNNLKPKRLSRTNTACTASNLYNDIYRGIHKAQATLTGITATDNQTERERSNVEPSNVQHVNRQHSATQFGIMSYSGMDLEPKTLQFGQSAVFDTLNKQYYADVSNGQKRHVLVNLHVNRITEIDTVKESFRCQFWVSFSWLPTYYEWLDYKDCQLSNNLIDWKPSWIPIIAFPELINQWKLHFAEKPDSGKFSVGDLNGIEEEIGYDPALCKFIKCKLECDMTFSTGFLLLNFPVDCQDLPISINEISGGCLFVAEKRKRSFASIYTISSVMEEWEFLNMIIEIGELVVPNESSLAQLKVRLKMQRRFEVYLWNVVFFMALISGLTLCSFAVEEVDLGERLAIIITLLLTSVAYQSNVFSTLPNVPYLTLLDKYIVTSFVFMTLVTVETAMLGTKYLDNDVHNGIVFMVTFISFIGYHIVFFILAKNKKRYEMSKLYMPSKTMLELYHESRDRMDVDWRSEKTIGSNWKIYTKYPDLLIATVDPDNDTLETDMGTKQ